MQIHNAFHDGPIDSLRPVSLLCSKCKRSEIYVVYRQKYVAHALCELISREITSESGNRDTLERGVGRVAGNVIFEQMSGWKIET